MQGNLNQSIDSNSIKASEIINNSEALLITAGAGIGVDSGLPDFRGNEGFWNAYPPIAKLGISFVDMANPYWFKKNPKLAWAFYGHRLNLYRMTTPHCGFTQLLEIGKSKPGGCFIFTSTVAGQFQQAGFSDEFIEECHGSIHHFQCNIPCTEHIWDARGIKVSVDEDKFQALEPFPSCINCNTLARPNILMFSDWNWIVRRTEMQNHRFSHWLEKLKNENMKLVIIELGAGEAVATVRHTSETIARDMNATLIRINPRDYNVSSGHISIPTGAAEGINLIYNNLKI